MGTARRTSRRARSAGRDAAGAARARGARAGVVEARARAGGGAGLHRGGGRLLRGVDAAFGALRGRVPRLLGPAGGLPDRGRTPTVAAERAEPGKVTPEQTADEFLAGSRVEWIEPPRPRAGRSTRHARGDARREALAPRGEGHPVRLQGADRFEKWVAVLQERVPYEEPIVLPMGEGLNVVRSEGELAVRCDCGHEFARRRATGRWRRRSTCATTPRSCSRSTRRWPTATPGGWSCASSTAPPAPASSRPRPCRRGIRGARVPARHRGLLPRLAGPRGAVGRRDHGPCRRDPLRAPPVCG